MFAGQILCVYINWIFKSGISLGYTIWWNKYVYKPLKTNLTEQCFFGKFNVVESMASRKWLRDAGILLNKMPIKLTHFHHNNGIAPERKKKQ